MPVVLDNDTFDAALNANKLLLVDFHATWCGPCKVLSPRIDELEREVGDGAFFAKVDVDDAPELAQRFGVMGVPTVLILKDGKEANRFVGVHPKDVLKSALE